MADSDSKDGAPRNGERRGFFRRLAQRLSSGRLGLDLPNLLRGRRIDADVLEELETRLLTADVGIDATEHILSDLHKKVARKELADVDALISALREAVAGILEPCARPLVIDPQHKPFTILVVGVNGSGKTTTIGKLARRFHVEGRSVVLAAGDTFRAAAIEQLSVWAERSGADCIAQHAGADPGAVVFDALQSAPVRPAHTESCSIAAARKVSPAASMTLRPSSARRRASLPMVVVLPEPLTPTTRMVKGLQAGSMTSGRAHGSRMPTTASRSAATNASTSASSLRATCLCSPERMCSVASTPTSAVNSRVSSSSRISASIRRPRKRLGRSKPSRPPRLSRWASRLKKPWRSPSRGARSLESKSGMRAS